MEDENNTPSKPTPRISLEEDKSFYQYLYENKKTISIRELIGFWDFQTRGVNVNNLINSDLESIGFYTIPPIDIGPLDAHVSIGSLAEKEEKNLSSNSNTHNFSNPKHNHLLTLAAIPSATLNQQDDSPLICVTPDEPINDALAIMLINDFSQLPVVDAEDREIILGAFSWESYGHAVLSGERPSKVKDAITQPNIQDLRTDLFQCTELIARDGFVLVTQLGRLTGIVTSADLTHQFDQLAKPFLAVGRAEQELKRVARLLIGEKGPNKHNEEIEVEKMMMGELQHFYKDNWDSLNWSIKKIFSIAGSTLLET